MAQSNLLSDKYVVGLTGGIGSGKSAASKHFESLGVDVVDADLVARLIVEKGSVVLYQIAQHFGADILLPSGELNRAKLREIIFSDDEAKQWLNDLMHPAIRQEIITKLVQAKSKYVLLSAPLLVENGLEQLCDRVLVVDVSEEIQLQRASLRDGVSVEQIKSIMASQSSREKRRSKAHDVIDNSGQIADLHTQVEALHADYLKNS